MGCGIGWTGFRECWQPCQGCVLVTRLARSLRFVWDTNLSRCSKQIRSLETFSFFDIIFFRFSTEFSLSTVTEKLPPVVVVTFSVIGLVATVVAELPDVPAEPHPIAGPDEVDGVDEDGPPSRESPPPPSPDLSIVLRGYYVLTRTLRHTFQPQRLLGFRVKLPPSLSKSCELSLIFLSQTGRAQIRLYSITAALVDSCIHTPRLERLP